MSTEPMPVEMLLSCLIPFRGDSHVTERHKCLSPVTQSLLFLKEAEMWSAWFAMF